MSSHLAGSAASVGFLLSYRRILPHSTGMLGNRVHGLAGSHRAFSATPLHLLIAKRQLGGVLYEPDLTWAFRI